MHNMLPWVSCTWYTTIFLVEDMAWKSGDSGILLSQHKTSISTVKSPQEEIKVSTIKVCNAGDLGSIAGLGRSPGEGNGNPLQYSCLENPMDRGAWWATVHGGLKELDTTERLSPSLVGETEAPVKQRHLPKVTEEVTGTGRT